MSPRQLSANRRHLRRDSQWPSVLFCVPSALTDREPQGAHPLGFVCKARPVLCPGQTVDELKGGPQPCLVTSEPAMSALQVRKQDERVEQFAQSPVGNSVLD